MAQKDAVKATKDNATCCARTPSRAPVEHLCKYLAMRIASDLVLAQMPLMRWRTVLRPSRLMPTPEESSKAGSLVLLFSSN
jgi:hypothetical protein